MSEKNLQKKNSKIRLIDYFLDELSFLRTNHGEELTLKSPLFKQINFVSNRLNASLAFSNIFRMKDFPNLAHLNEENYFVQCMLAVKGNNGTLFFATSSHAMFEIVNSSDFDHEELKSFLKSNMQILLGPLEAKASSSLSNIVSDSELLIPNHVMVKLDPSKINVDQIFFSEK